MKRYKFTVLGELFWFLFSLSTVTLLAGNTNTFMGIVFLALVLYIISTGVFLLLEYAISYFGDMK